MFLAGDRPPMTQPQLPPQQTEGGLPPEVKNGTQTEITVGPTGGEGLWNIAQELNKGLDDNMRKTNSTEVIFGKLRDTAVKDMGFKAGTDDGRLPGSYQGSQRSGRDLDLIYASDKFKIDLNKPEGAPAAPPETKAPADGVDTKSLDLDPKNQAAWDGYRAKNPDFDAQFKALSPDVQKAYVANFNYAAEKDLKDPKAPKEVDALGKLMTSAGFKELDDGHKQKALNLAFKQGAAAADELVNNAGFRTLKDTKMPSLDDDENRNPVSLVLDRAADDPQYLKAMQNAMRGENGFEKIDKPYEAGQAMVHAADYVGRDNGYKKFGDQATSADQKSDALSKLWRNVISNPTFLGGNDLAQCMKINDWVDRRGFVNEDVRPQI